MCRQSKYKGALDFRLYNAHVLIVLSLVCLGIVAIVLQSYAHGVSEFYAGYWLGASPVLVAIMAIVIALKREAMLVNASLGVDFIVAGVLVAGLACSIVDGINAYEKVRNENYGRPPIYDEKKLRYAYFVAVAVVSAVMIILQILSACVKAIALKCVAYQPLA